MKGTIDQAIDALLEQNSDTYYAIVFQFDTGGRGGDIGSSMLQTYIRKGSSADAIAKEIIAELGWDEENDFGSPPVEKISDSESMVEYSNNDEEAREVVVAKSPKLAKSAFDVDNTFWNTWRKKTRNAQGKFVREWPI